MPPGQKDPPRFSLFGLILVFLGGLFLLQTLGVLPWGLWSTLWRFWPVFLILIGLSLLWGGRSWFLFALSTLVLLAAIGAAILMAGSAPSTAPAFFSQPLQGIERAEVEINFGAGELFIGSLSAASPNLAEGKGNPSVKQDFRVRGSTGVLHLSLPGRVSIWPPGEKGFLLETSLTPQIPLELTVKTGASDAQIDLTQLQVTRLRVDAGAARLHLRLPAAVGNTQAVVKAGAAQVDITIPPAVSARITSNSGLGSFTVDTSRFPKVDDDHYESPDYPRAAHRVDLQVDSGVAQVEIH